MLKKITSILVTTFVLSVNGAPFLSWEQCDMPCCQVQVSCCSEMSSCGGSMTTCEHPLVLPLVVAPVSKVDQQVDETFIAATSNLSDLFITQFVYENIIDRNLVPEPPPHHQIPLLI